VTKRRRFLACIVTAFAAVGPALAAKRRSNKMVVEIVPGSRIGDLRLGAPAAKLPSSASVRGDVGQVHGVHFSLQDGAVDDVWIDDLRSFPHELRFRNKEISKTAPLDELKRLFGPCHELPDIVGGTFFRCESGLTLGSDVAGATVQIRLKPPTE
jgi:hypothetical protein